MLRPVTCILHLFRFACICGLAVSLSAVSRGEGTSSAPVHADIVVYGGTPAGVMAAVAAARLGHSVALIDINGHVGGMISGGLVATDIGDRATVGGLADEFFQRVVKYYATQYGADSAEMKASRNGLTLEPHVAEIVFEQMLKEQPGITLWRRHRYRSVRSGRSEMEEGRSEPGSKAAEDGRLGKRIVSLTVDDLASGAVRTFTGDLFIDASYEGDLMAGAHVPYRVGREARAEYGELLAGVSMGPREQRGLGDQRTMAYNYRVSVTSETANRVLFPKPEHYDPAPFVDTDGRRVREGNATGFGSFFTTVEKAHPNHKYDANWGDFPGNSEGYADGDWATRDRIAARIRDHVQSRLYYLQNDPDLPEAFRNEARTWGLPKDEFADNGNFPFQLYVREARRMVGRYVVREADLTQDRWKADGVATGSYGVDCHVVQELREDGRLIAEHTRHVACNNWDIPYRSLVPPDVENLLVPVCCSATHVAYCSLRMEPVYMMLGHAAGDAAHLALADKATVQNVDPQKLRTLLRQEGAILDAGYQPPVKIAWQPGHPHAGEPVEFRIETGAGITDPLTHISWDFAGDGKVGAQGEKVSQTFAAEKVYTVGAVVEDQVGRRRLVSARVPVGAAEVRDVTMDDFEAALFGRWDGTFPDYLPGPTLRYSDIFLGPGIQRDVVRNGKKAPARARFQPVLPATGRYEVCLGFRPSKRQATNVPVVIHMADGVKNVVVDERTETTPFNFTPIGEFRFKAGDAGYVEITNGGTDGYVALDGVRWVWMGE